LPIWRDPAYNVHRRFVACVKAEFADASHNVPTYLVGHGAMVVVQVVTPYSGFERLRRLVAAHGGEILHNDFEAKVTVRAHFAVDRFLALDGTARDV
jgi:putative IMPACT (imprinted ancient) family translation regulator